jgi:hypothetical protein
MMAVTVIISLTTSYFYLRICYSRFIILHSETKWIIWPHKEVWHGPHRKLRFQQFFNCCICILCHGNIFTELWHFRNSTLSTDKFKLKVISRS